MWRARGQQVKETGCSLVRCKHVFAVCHVCPSHSPVGCVWLNGFIRSDGSDVNLGPSSLFGDRREGLEDVHWGRNVKSMTLMIMSTLPVEISTPPEGFLKLLAAGHLGSPTLLDLHSFGWVANF